MSVPKNFRTYDLSIEFYRDCKAIKLPYHLRDQLLRAASSVTLNLAEGTAKPTSKDKLRFYAIAYGSIKEVQAIIKLEELLDLHGKADHLAACLYKLTHQ